MYGSGPNFRSTVVFFSLFDQNLLVAYQIRFPAKKKNFENKINSREIPNFERGVHQKIEKI